MGVTPLLTNSQERSLTGPFSRNISMNAINKLRQNYKPTVEYIEKIPNFTVEVKTLLREFENCKSLDWIDNFMQLKFAIMQRYQWHDVINSMPYTKSVFESLTKYIPYNSIYYRYVKPHTCYNWHVDKMESCLHIPLITNPGCKFVYENNVFSMPADGSVYFVNNSIFHTFANAGTQPRLHITLDIF